jgi:hypothetical protein
MVHPKFLETLRALDPAAVARVNEIAPMFC